MRYKPDLADLLDQGVIIRDGDGWIKLADEDLVHVGIVASIEGYGPHEAAIFVDQNRYHASEETAIQGAYEILEMYWWDHYQDHYNELVADFGEQEVEDSGLFTETFDGWVWTLSAADAIAVIRSTDAEKFIEIDEDLTEY